MEDCSAAVRGWIQSSGLTAAAVARRAGVSGSTVHRILNGLVDPTAGTLAEIALACGVQLDLAARPLSAPLAAAAARVMLEAGYEPPAAPGLAAWRERLPRLARAAGPVEIVRAAGIASSPLDRPGAVLLHGEVTLARLASAGDASKGLWAVSGAAGLSMPPPQTAAPEVTILWCQGARTVTHLLGDTSLRRTENPDLASVAVIEAEPQLFAGAFNEGIVRYAAPIQIILDCVAQGGAVADDAIKEAMSW